MWAIYKKTAALQVSLIRPTISDEKYRNVIRPGAIFLEMANGIQGKDKEYDWSNKVNFAISANDLSIVYKAVQDSKRNQGKLDLKILHDPGAGGSDKGKLIKTITIVNAPKEGTYYLSIFYNNGTKSSVPISNGELYMLLKYIEDNQNTVLGDENQIVAVAA